MRRTVVQAARLAEQVAANLRAGADFDKLAKEYHYDDNAQPTRMTIKLPPQNVVRARGEFLATQLAASIGRLALALEIDEVGVAEFHRKDCPWGFHVLVRIK